MIRLLKVGRYSLLKTVEQEHIKINRKSKIYLEVQLDSASKSVFRIVTAKGSKALNTKGKYKLYEVKDEKKLANAFHLELYSGEGRWEGFLLPSKFSIKTKNNAALIPANEIITKAFA